MVVDLGKVENKEAKVYIKKEGFYTLKCEEVKFVKNSTNGNPIYKFVFKNKNGEYFNDEITITPNTFWKIKQLADAFGFTYDKVNIFHFVGMYLVGHIVGKKVRNNVNEIIEVFECKQYGKSAKLTNEIPPEGSVPVSYEANEPINTAQSFNDANIPDIDFDDEMIPF